MTGVDGVKDVAVKTMENGASEEDRVRFLQEAAIMGQFNNPYIVKIYGILTSSHPVGNLLKICIELNFFLVQYMLICELMSKDLHRHLHTLKIMGYIIMKILRVSSRFNSITLCSTLKQSDAGAMLLSYSRQVASAMVYLSGKGYVHCDLAARNILLSEDGVCKVNL